MDDWRARIAGAAAERDAGSWAVARRAAEGLALAAGQGEAALRTAIEQLLQGQPSMAALRNLANAVAWATDSGDPRAAAAAAHDFVERGDTATRAIAEHAAALLHGHEARRAVTISASAAVEAALAVWRGPALVLESRPRLEGRALARRLAETGIATELAVDAATRPLLAPGDVVLLGADSVTPEGVTNKIGSAALAAAARERRLPVYALAGTEKWWPQALPEADEAARDPREVLPEPIPSIRVRNPYFEMVPFAQLTAVVTPDGPWPPRRVRAALTRWHVHPRLRQVTIPPSEAAPDSTGAP
ncbi:MAG: hypothetical protein ACRDJN_26085 [Chloroflexota bacterium]